MSLDQFDSPDPVPVDPVIAGLLIGHLRDELGQQIALRRPTSALDVEPTRELLDTIAEGLSLFDALKQGGLPIAYRAAQLAHSVCETQADIGHEIAEGRSEWIGADPDSLDLVREQIVTLARVRDEVIGGLVGQVVGSPSAAAPTVEDGWAHLHSASAAQAAHGEHHSSNLPYATSLT